MFPNGKATVAVPKLSDDDHVELADMLPGGPAQDPDEDIMQLARLGDIKGIEQLFESGKFDPLYSDAEGITPLHVLMLIPNLELARILILCTVGGYKQPVCHVPVSPEGWSRC